MPTPTSPTISEWLTLSEAADLLGVHPATVREWADRGELPAQRTAGGHRRFRRNDVVVRMKAHPAIAVLIQSALGRVRLDLTAPESPHTSWRHLLDEHALSQHRELGRALLATLQRGLTGELDPAAFAAAAETLGQDYARLSTKAHLPLSESVRAFLYFHAAILDAILQYGEAFGSQMPTAGSTLAREVNAFCGNTLVALIRHYE